MNREKRLTSLFSSNSPEGVAPGLLASRIGNLCGLAPPGRIRTLGPTTALRHGETQVVSISQIDFPYSGRPASDVTLQMCTSGIEIGDQEYSTSFFPTIKLVGNAACGKQGPV